MMRRNNLKSGDICYVINRDVCDGTVKNISSHTAIIVEKLDRYRYRCLHKNKLKVFYYTVFEKIKTEDIV